MKTEYKHTLMVWAIVGLAFMNISTLITVLYHKYQSDKLETFPLQVQNQSETTSENFSGRYFRDKLHFDNSQMEKFREFNPIFRHQARSITLELTIIRKKMLDEMAVNNSDTVRLNMLSDSIGILHSDLKKITYKYYLEIKNMCDKNQQKRLEQIFMEVFPDDKSLENAGKGRFRMQRGKRNGN